MENVINTYADSSTSNSKDTYLLISLYGTSTSSNISNNKSSLSSSELIFNAYRNSTSDINLNLRNDDIFYNKMFKELSKYSEYDDYEELINFLNKICNNINYPDFITWSIEKLEDYQKLNLILSILSSDTNIFNSWYKKILLNLKESKDIVLSSRAQDILNLYKNKFEEIKCM